MRTLIISAVSGLEGFIIRDIIIKRLEQEKTPEALELIGRYNYLLNNRIRLFDIARRSVSEIFTTFSDNVPKSDLEDMVCSVITSTIQSESTEYRKYMKSRNGFWSNRYEIMNPASFPNFEKIFMYFMFKAVQSETRNLFYYSKKMVTPIVDSDGNSSMDDLSNEERIETFDSADDRETEIKSDNMEKFELAVEKMKCFVRTSDKFDDLDRKIFEKWIAKKDDENFNARVNMLKDVYRPVIEEMEGKKITASALHIRWSHMKVAISKYIQQFSEEI